MELAGDAPALLQRGLLLQLAVGGPIGECELQEVTQADAPVDAFLGNRCSLGGDGQHAVQLAVRADRDPGAVGDPGGVEHRPQRRGCLVGVERSGDRLQRAHRLAQAGMFLDRPTPLDVRSGVVELGVNDHHAIFDTEIRRPQDFRPGRRRDTHGESGAERRDLRWLRQLDQLTDGGVEGFFVAEQPRRALVRLDEPPAQELNGDREHGGDGAGQDQPAHQARRIESAHRGGDGHGEHGAQDEDDTDDRFPPLAVEGNPHHRHEEQDSEPASDAACGQHEKGHRGHVQSRPDQERAGRHGTADHEQGQDHHQEQGADEEVPTISGSRGPGHTELTHHGHDDEREIAGQAVAQIRRRHPSRYRRKFARG